MFDLIIRNATVIDGTRSPGFHADLAVTGDRITGIGDLNNAHAAETIDATGKVVAPGFIDVHNHSDGWLLKTPQLASKTLQGFTTEVIMSDGISYAPVNENTAREWVFYLRGLNALRLDEYRGWKSIAEYMDCIHNSSVQNAIPQVPYANVRSMVCGFGKDWVDDFQMRSIKEEIRRGMEAGAVGLSTGLDYIVQCFATTDELVEACTVVAEYDGLYVTHMRYKSGLMRALKEAVEIGKRSGAKVHISHLKGQSPGEADEILSYIDNVARHEVEFSFDIYPYQPGSTMLNYLLPYDVWEDGPLAALSKMQEPKVRAHFRDGLEAYRMNLDKMHIAWVPGKENDRLQGMMLSDYIAETGQADDDALIDLLIEERLAPLLVFHEGDDALVHPFLKHDLFMMGTDGIFQEGGLVNPRQYGSAGRLIGPCVRDHKLFSLEDAVYKLTGHAAERFGLTKRGTLKEGHFADLVVFDPETVFDPATITDPRQYTVGIENVVVNGRPIIRDGDPIESIPAPLPGRSLKYRQED